MQPIYPHGESRRLLSLLSDDSTIELVGYADGAFGITRDGRSVGVWPASEELECVKAFHRLGEFREATPCLVVSRAAFQAASRVLASRAILN
jgi:hypothetical protein